MLKVIFSDNAAANTKIQKWVGILTIVGLLGGFGIWFSPIADPWWATEPEATMISEKAVKIHEMKTQQTPYALENDVKHLANMMVDEQIGDANSEITNIEDLMDINPNENTPTNHRKIERLKEDIERFEKGYQPEQGVLHSHDG